MKRFIGYAIIVLFIATACVKEQNKKDYVPENVLSPEKMELVLVDVQMVEGSLLYKRSKGKVNNELSDYYYNHIFEKYGISKSTFDESLDFYKNHIPMFDEIYKNVLKDLEKKKTELKQKN
jgi:uncharacterized protein DUF4296